MAMVKERRSVYRAEISALEGQGGDDGMVAAQIEELKAKIADEDRKRERWQLENKRRRHNWIPLCVELMKVLAKEGKLESAIAEAKQKKAQAGNAAGGGTKRKAG
jgi:ubiquitin carboxyl-terminal hydrolase L5